MKVISAKVRTPRRGYISLVWVSIHYEEKVEKQDLQLGKVDDRIPVLQLTRSRSKKQNESDI